MPTSAAAPTFTGLLVRAAGGESAAGEALEAVLTTELRNIAAGREHDDPVRPAEMITEAWKRLLAGSRLSPAVRDRFYTAAARSLRTVLVEDAAAGRGALAATMDEPVNCQAMDRLLTRLARKDPRKARLVELRFFGGLAVEEAAGVLKLSRETAAEQWRMARAWLYRQMGEEGT